MEKEKEGRGMHRRRQLEEESWRGGKRDTEAVAEAQSKGAENRKAGEKKQSVYR